MPEIHALTQNFGGRALQIISSVEVKNIATGAIHATKAIWDTGSTGSVITNYVTGQLGLQSTGTVNVRGVNVAKEVDKYFVNITLNNKRVSLNVPVTSCDELSPDNSIGVLIGMDIISHGDFAITNFQGRTKMSFRTPSIQDIDFVRGIKEGRPIHKEKLPGRNDPCFCGSGKKYKYCCGKKK